MKKQFIKLTVICLSLSGCLNEERPDAADMLLSAYQSSCPSIGRWTDSAIQQNQALVGIVTTLRDTDPCTPYASQLNTISQFSEQIQKILKDDGFKKTREAEEKVQELTLALAQASDPATQSALAGVLATTQIELATAKALQKAKSVSDTQDAYQIGTERFAQLMQSLLSQGNGLSMCLKNSPAASMKLASQLVSIGGSFISPVMGAGTAVVGQLFNFAVDAARNHTFNKAILELHTAKLPTALSCGLEAMTQFYCQANDSFDLIQLQASQYPRPGVPPADLWMGIDLMGRRLPTLMKWVISVRNGVQPSDPSNASRQNLIWQKSLHIDNQVRNVEGILNEQIPQYLTARDGIIKTAIARSILGSTAGHLLVPGTSGSNSFSSVFSSFGETIDLSCKLVFGINADSSNTPSCASRGPNGEILSTEEVFRNITKDFNLERFQINWLTLQTKARERFEIEFFSNIVVDPEGLLKRAFDPIEDNITPAEILRRTRTYLISILARPNPGNPQQDDLIRFTIERIDEVLERLTQPIPTTDPNGDPIDRLGRVQIALQRIQDIFNALELRNGPQFFRDRISDMIRADVLLRLRNGDFPREIEEILRSTTLDIRERIQSAGLGDLQLIQLDLNQSRSLMQGQIAVFNDFFGKLDAFEMALEHLEKQANSLQEPLIGPNRPNRQSQAKLCALIYSSNLGKFPNKKIQSLCENTVLSSIYPDPSNELSLHMRELMEKTNQIPPHSRYCTFYRYLRAGRIAEIENASQTEQNPPTEIKPSISSFLIKNLDF